MKNKKQNIPIFIAIILIISVLPITSFAYNLHAVKGTLFIDDIIADSGIEIKIQFPDEDITGLTFEHDGEFNYNIGFQGHDWETGSFYVFYDGEYKTPYDNKTIYIEEEIVGFYVDLHVYTTPMNQAPDKPTNPQPEDGEENIGLNPTLTVDVTDPDGDTLDVTFYDASDDSLIETDENVPDGGSASTPWSDLDYNTEYSWYAIADDGEYQTQSNTWSFTTKNETNAPPNKPFNPQPENEATEISVNPTLSVEVTDPDSDTMTVAFYDASDDSLIGTDTSVASGDRAQTQWNDLDYDTQYSWYAIANDSAYETQSDTWTFTTQEPGTIPPTIEILKPLEDTFYFRNTPRFPIIGRLLPRTRIISYIDVQVNPEDADGEITKVEFYVDDELKHTETNENYTWRWNERALFRHTIKAVAYDNDNLTAEESIDVRILNLGILREKD